jgi:integrase/recombinase XerC
VTEREPVSAKTETAVHVSDLHLYAQDWLTDCQLRQHSHRTIEVRRDFINNLLWFLDHQGHTVCGTSQLRDFFRYLTDGHTEPCGRWGNPKNTRPLRPVTIKDYHAVLRAWFRWLVKDGTLDVSPLTRIAAPVARTDQKEPLNPDQVTKLIAAAHGSHQPKRDVAIVSLLLDSGIRASELCSLRVSDLSLENRSFRVQGKGNKFRECYYGKATSKALNGYLRSQRREPHEPLFYGERGRKAKEPLTRSGLLQLMRRLSHSAGIHPLVSVHQMRRTFAVSILRNGANLAAVQRLMGHETITVTQKYLLLAQTDIEAQHRAYSPCDVLNR